MESMPQKGSSVRKVSPELKERAVSLVLEIRQSSGVERGAIFHVAKQLGVNYRSLIRWVRLAEEAKDEATKDRERIRQLERENFELRRSNEILKAATNFFQAEFDRPQPR
jgi:transposase